MTREEAMTAVAQGVINIDEGLTTIEKDSRIYNAMLALVKDNLARHTMEDDRTLQEPQS